MKLGACLIGLLLVSLIAGFCLIMILTYFEPQTAGRFVFVSLYASLFIAAVSVLSLAGWFIRYLSRRCKTPIQAVHQLKVSLRQGFLLSAILIIALILQSYRVLAWWNLIIIVLAVGSAEWILMRRN